MNSGDPPSHHHVVVLLYRARHLLGVPTVQQDVHTKVKGVPANFNLADHGLTGFAMSKYKLT